MRRSFLAFVLLFAACGDERESRPADPTDLTDHSDDPRFDELRQALQADLDTNLATAASVAVWLDGEIMWVGGLGAADADVGPAPGLDTLFMIGSDTKKITALSLLRKVQAGVVSLDATVGELLPDLDMQAAPDFGSATLRDLLSHQGGIMEGIDEGTDTTDQALESYVLGAFAENFYQLAPPGRIWNYSNPNFSVAGLIDQELDTRMWPDIVEQDIFATLGMTRTFARKSEVDTDYAAGVGYAASAGATPVVMTLEDCWENAFVRPAGLVWSTPVDQMRLAAFLVDGAPELLSAELLAELHTPQVALSPDEPTSYGFGLFLSDGIHLGAEYFDVPVWSHGGNTNSHTSTFYILPEQRFAISILSNGANDNFNGSVAAAVWSLLADRLPPPTTPPELPFDPAELDALLGTYYDEHNVGEVIVTRDGDALSVEAPLLDFYEVPYEHTMHAITTRTWIANIEGETMDFTFIDGPDGETYMRNRQVVAIRPPAGVGP